MSLMFPSNQNTHPLQPFFISLSLWTRYTGSGVWVECDHIGASVSCYSTQHWNCEMCPIAAWRSLSSTPTDEFDSVRTHPCGVCRLNLPHCPFQAPPTPDFSDDRLNLQRPNQTKMAPAPLSLWSRMLCSWILSCLVLNSNLGFADLGPSPKLLAFITLYFCQFLVAVTWPLWQYAIYKAIPM